MTINMNRMKNLRLFHFQCFFHREWNVPKLSTKAVLVRTLKQDILTLALVVFSSVLESLFSPFGAQPCNESLVRRNLIQKDKKLQQFCDKICQPPHFPAEIYLLRNCRCNLTFCRVFENEKKIHLVDGHWSGTSGGKIDCCPLICALAQTGQSQDNHLAHTTTTIYPKPCDRTHFYVQRGSSRIYTPWRYWAINMI